MTDDRPIPETYWVLKGQFLAGSFPASTEGDAEQTRQRMTAFLDADFDTFIDLTRPDELIPYLSTLAEAAEANEHDIRYNRFAIGDRGLPNREQMTAILDAIDAAIAQGRKVYLHCWGGIGRTGMTVGCYLVRHGLQGRQALIKLNELYQTAAQSTIFPRSPETEEQERFVLDWMGDRQQAMDNGQ